MIFRVMPSHLLQYNEARHRLIIYGQHFRVVQPSELAFPSMSGPVPELASGCYRMQPAKHLDNMVIAGLIPLTQVRALADLVPIFGEKADNRYHMLNVIETA